MKASQISTVNRKGKTIVSSLAALAILTFFAAGPAEARNRDRVRQVQIESRFVTTQDRDVNELGTDFRDSPQTRCAKAHNNRRANNSYGGEEFGRAPLNVRGIYLIPPAAPQGKTIYNIGDTGHDRRKAERREQRRRIIEGLKNAGVIREPGQPATTTTQSNNTGSTTTTKPVPKPKPKQPKVTKLPNGDVITEYPDGRREVKMKNGDTVTTHKNGKRVVTNANGDTTETHPSGYRKTTNRYGDGTAHFADGTRIDFKSSGEATLTTPDGKKYHRMPGKGFKEVD